MKRLFTLILLLSIGATPLFAQGNGGGSGSNNKGSLGVHVFPISILKLAGPNGNSVSLATSSPTEAGMPMDLSQANDSSMWLNYTAVVGRNSRPKVDVYAKISAGTVPAGMQLKVKAQDDVGAGRGHVGSPIGEITLSSVDQKLIQNIKTSYTGAGPNKGHQLIYRLDFAATQYAAIDFDNSTTVTVEYTITD
jgi:hypothetical protein